MLLISHTPDTNLNGAAGAHVLGQAFRQLSSVLQVHDSSPFPQR
jgi:hypothetical protein